MTEPHQDDVEGAVERLGPENALVEALHKFKEYSADYIAPVDLALLIAAAEALLTDWRQLKAECEAKQGFMNRCADDAEHAKEQAQTAIQVAMRAERALSETRAVLEEVVGALENEVVEGQAPHLICTLCHTPAKAGLIIRHTADCIITRADALLEKKDG